MGPFRKEAEHNCIGQVVLIGGWGARPCDG